MLTEVFDADTILCATLCAFITGVCIGGALTDNADRFGGGSEMIRDGDPDHLWEQMETAMRFVIMSAR